MTSQDPAYWALTIFTELWNITVLSYHTSCSITEPLSFSYIIAVRNENRVSICAGKMLWSLCFVAVISLAVQTLKLLKLLQSWSLTLSGKLFSGSPSGWLSLCFTGFFPRLYFTGGQGEIGSSSILWFVIISITITCYSTNIQTEV